MRDEIHIAEEPLDVALHAAVKLEVQAAEFEELARYAEWLLKQSETFQALASEWASLRGSRLMLDELKTRRGRIFRVSCDHGIHESLQSAEHALFLLVDSHRVRVTDTAEFRDRVMAANVGMLPKEALRRCEQIAAQIREANPAATGVERDALCIAHLEALEEAAATPVMRGDP